MMPRLTRANLRAMRPALAAVLLFVLVGFLALGSGYSFYWRVAYIVLFAVGGGWLWAWLNLQWLDMQLERRTTHSQVGLPLEGRLRVANRSRWPRAWLEVEELTDLPQAGAGRALNLPGKEIRSWRHRVACHRRGIYYLGPVQVTSGDPFGLFKLTRRFLDSHRVVVYPRAEPIPNFHLPLATVPSDGRLTVRSQQISAQASTVRPYIDGDSVKKVHWPYTARMGTLMVKEFDQGVSSNVWLVLDLHQAVQAGGEFDNTEELTITVAASIATRLLSMGVPVGLAGHGDQIYFLRPDQGQGQAERILELLAMMRARGSDSLARVVYQIQPQISRLNTLVLITPTMEMEWMYPASTAGKRGVHAMAVLVDRGSYGATEDIAVQLEQLQHYDVPAYVVRKGDRLDDSLRSPVNPPVLRVPIRAPLEIRR